MVKKGYRKPKPPPEQPKVTDYHDFCTKDTSKETREEYFIGPIWINACTCNKCGDYIRSKNKHDMVWCSCKNVAVDGGSWYAKRNFVEADSYTDHTEYFSDVDPEHPYGVHNDT